MARRFESPHRENSTPLSYALSVLVVLMAASGLMLASSVSSTEQEQEQDLAKVDWWKKTNFYHIYLRSFKDSNGDGNGDLRGVTQELDYLKQIGVETILMAPFYKSPMKDCGYDIEDYLDIQPMFGTMADFDELIVELKKRDMRIVVDFVPNHSSNKHPWFVCSERALVDPENCGKYKDYYVWSNSTRYEGKYPSNWISVFGGGPAWRWSELRQQFYLHQFLPEQPDLNFKNPAVREEFNNIARFWLHKGVDGLRVDAIIHLIEDADFTDDLVNPDYKEGDDPWQSLLHVNTLSLSESAEVVGEWHKLVEREFPHDKKVIMTEAYDKIPKLLEYYGTDNENRFSDLPFNTELFRLNEDNLESDFIEKVVRAWIEPMLALNWPIEQGAMSPWIFWMTGNHDNSRIANKIGVKNIFFLRLLTYILPGVPLNYYGEELPLKNLNISLIPQRTIDEGEPSRLAFRAPMAWTADEPSGGFSSTGDIWLPLNEDWKTSNVKYLLSDESEPKNELKQFVQLQQLRQKLMDIFVFGDLVFFHQLSSDSQMLLAIGRTHEKFGNLLMLANMDPSNEIEVHLKDQSESIMRAKLMGTPQEGQIVLLSHIDALRAPQVLDGERVKIDGLVLARSQVVLIKYDSVGQQVEQQEPEVAQEEDQPIEQEEVNEREEVNEQPFVTPISKQNKSGWFRKCLKGPAKSLASCFRG